MSLPKGFVDEVRDRTSLAQVVGRKVTWDMRKSNQAKGDFWAPCPFHQEKTASFHVDDKKGFYYCFGCHAKGDAIGFVKETENVGFIEAVEILAREAGMQIPARDPQAQQKADRRTELANVMEQAVQWLRLQLKTAQGTAAREYLARRGLDAQAQERWEIGYAPDARHALLQALKDKGVPEEQIIAAGLAIKPDDGGAPYDRFRGRIIFPIRDPRGRAISLGGRALDPNARAKYLNGPETDLFDKGRSLFNYGPARAAAGKGAPLIVAEGYMDVIALSEAGFGAAVAPLGTAVTESQLELVWRVAPEPVFALDGDKAGQRAALRTADLALPHLVAGRSLRFAMLPEGLDPDDLIKTRGAGAMQAVIDAAEPMIAVLWRRETEGRAIDSPERRAALDRDLRNLLQRIKDPSIRGHYADAFKELRYRLFRPQNPAPSGGARGGFQPGRGWQRGPEPTRMETKATALAAQGAGAVEEQVREAVILATLLTHPGLLDRFETQLERLVPTDPDHAELQRLILEHHEAADLKAAVAAAGGAGLMHKLFRRGHVQIAPGVRRADEPEIAALSLAEELAKLTTARAMRRELAEAEAEIGALADEGLTFRLSRAARAARPNRAGR